MKPGDEQIRVLFAREGETQFIDLGAEPQKPNLLLEI